MLSKFMLGNSHEADVCHLPLMPMTLSCSAGQLLSCSSSCWTAVNSLHLGIGRSLA